MENCITTNTYIAQYTIAKQHVVTDLGPPQKSLSPPLLHSASCPLLVSTQIKIYTTTPTLNSITLSNNKNITALTLVHPLLFYCSLENSVTLYIYAVTEYVIE